MYFPAMLGITPASPALMLFSDAVEPENMSF